MAGIIAFSRVPVKPTRRTARKPAPFGQGLTCHTIEDERWLMEHSYDPHEPTDAEWEAMALQAEWDARWDAAEFGPEKCACCGDDAPGALTAGLCDRCALGLDVEGPEEDPEGGVCPGCRAWSDFVERDTGLCPVCDLRASETSNGSSGGY